MFLQFLFPPILVATCLVQDSTVLWTSGLGSNDGFECLQSCTESHQNPRQHNPRKQRSKPRIGRIPYVKQTTNQARHSLMQGCFFADMAQDRIELDLAQMSTYIYIFILYDYIKIALIQNWPGDPCTSCLQEIPPLFLRFMLTDMTRSFALSKPAWTPCRWSNSLAIQLPQPCLFYISQRT